MISELPELLRPVHDSAARDEFIIYKCANPVTDCEHQYLAVNVAQSFLLSFGELLLGFDFELPEDTERWLTEDYVQTAQRFTLQLGTLQECIKKTYFSRALFGFVKYHEDLALASFELSLNDPDVAERGTEYVIQDDGDYQRWFRMVELHAKVTPAERALLDLCCPAFNILGQRFRELLLTPPTIRFRELATDKDLAEGDLQADKEYGAGV